MNISSIQNHVAFQKYVRPALIVTGIVLAVGTVALAILLFAPGAAPAIAFHAKLAMASGSAVLATLFLGATRQPQTTPIDERLDEQRLFDVYEKLERIISRGYRTEGPFRENGNHGRVQALMNNVDRPLDDFTVFDACSALKQLVSRSQITLVLDSSNLNLEAAVEAFKNLSPLKKRMVKSSMDLLAFLSANSHETKMSVYNLAVAAHSLIITTESRDIRRVIALTQEIFNHGYRFAP